MVGGEAMSRAHLLAAPVATLLAITILLAAMATCATACAPHVVIAGVPKCATTAIHDILTTHPSFSAPLIKEPNYNFNITSGPAYKEYIEQLGATASSKKLTIDSSTHYLWNISNMAALHKFCPTTKVIVVLCDPVRRCVHRRCFT